MAGLHPSLWVPAWEGQPCREERGWQAQRSGTLSCHPLFGTLWLTASFLWPCTRACPLSIPSGRAGGGGVPLDGPARAGTRPSLHYARLVRIFSAVFPSPASLAVSLSLSRGDERQSWGVGNAVQIAGRVPGAASAAGSSGLPRPHAGPPAPPNGRSLKLAETRGTLGWGRGVPGTGSVHASWVKKPAYLRIGPRGRRSQKLLIKCLSP